MRDKADPVAPSGRKRGTFADIVPYALIVVAVLLAWQVAIQPFLQRAPASVAIRLAPGSPMVLRRAAEAEFSENRIDNAGYLARESLVRAPFSARALRVVGLTEARAGRLVAADDILTLAGNRSLRDDPSHAWLVEHRLRQGDYASSFAHADTLVRRREDIRPQVFQLFTVSATADRERALPVITRLVAARPPWRQSYLDSLYASTDGLQVAVALAVMLEPGPAPLTDEELRQFYMHALDKGQLPAVRAVRERLNRPPASAGVTNGGFDNPAAPEPFQWRLDQRAGLIAEIVPDDLRPRDPALRVEYDGFSPSRVAEQLMFLAPGRHQLTAEVRTDSGDPDARLAWTVTCSPGDLEILAAPSAPTGATAWGTLSAGFTVPQNCPAQWLRLEIRAGNRRAPIVAWFDRIAVMPFSSQEN